MTLALQLGRLYMAMIRLRQQVRRSFDLTQTESTVIEYVFMQHPRPAYATDIADYCGISRSAVTKLLDKLTADARIVRQPAAHDKRKAEVSLEPTFLHALSTIDASLIDGLLPILDTLDALTINPIQRFLHDLTEAANRMADTWE